MSKELKHPSSAAPHPEFMRMRGFNSGYHDARMGKPAAIDENNHWDWGLGYIDGYRAFFLGEMSSLAED